MGMFADRAKKKEDEINKSLGKQMTYKTSSGVSLDTPKLPISDKIKLSNEKTSRTYAQIAPDMQPVQSTGLLKKLATYKPVGNNPSEVWANKTAELPIANRTKTLPPVSTVRTPQIAPVQSSMPSLSNLSPYRNNSVQAKSQGGTAAERMSNAWLNATGETPQTITKPVSGTLSGLRNVLSSYGDTSKGADVTIKANLKQSIANESNAKKYLSDMDNTINNLITTRNKYPVGSEKYSKINKTIDDMYSYADEIRNRPTDNTEGSTWFNAAAEKQQKAVEGLSGAKKELAEAGISVGDNLVTIALSGGVEPVALAMLGAKSAGSRMNELNQQGVSAADALGRGALSGVIEAATEKIGMDNLYDIVLNRKTTLMANLLKQMASEGSEEALGYLANYGADAMSGDKNAKFDWNELAENTIQGALSGAMFGLGGTATSAIGNKIDSSMADLNYKNNAPNAESYKKVLPVPNGPGNNVSLTNVDETAKQYGVSLPKIETLQAQPNIDEQSANGGNPAITTKEFKDVYENENDLIPVEKGLSQTDVNAYNFIKKIADKKNSSTSKIYDAYKKSRDNLLESVLNDNFEAMKSYTPQGAQLIYSDSYVPDGYGQDVSTGDAQRVSNNTKWYSEVYNEYGHKPNQSQLKQFIEKKVLNDVKHGGGEFVPAEIAKKLSAFDSLLSGYERIANNGVAGDVLEIRQNESGNYEVDYGDKTQHNANQNSVPIQSAPSNMLGIVNPDVQALFDAASEAKSKTKSAYQSAVSGWAPFERMSKVDTDNARNIAARVNKYAQKGGTTDTILTRGLYDRNGNKVSDKSFISVASQVPKADISSFNDYWQNLHNIDRQAQGKPVNANTAEQSQNIVAQYEIAHPEFKEYKKAISDYWDSFTQTWLVGGGLISANDYAAMKKMYPNYVPTFRVEDNASGGNGTINAGKKIIGGKAIGKAKGSTAEVMSFEESFAKKIQSVIAAASKNDISSEIYSFAKDMPSEAAQNGILLNEKNSSVYDGQMDLDGYVEDIDKNIAREINKGNFEITFYENGKAKTMKISRDVYEAFRFLDSKLGDNRGVNAFANLGRFFTNKMRALTTTYNPLFFMTNIMRDAQTYAINNTASNSAVATKNYLKAIVSMAKQAETYNQYKALGGSQNGYIGTDMYKNTVERVNPNKTTLQKALAIPRAPLTAMEKLGEVTEAVPRYAEYLNTIDKQGNTEAGRLQASLNAADVTVNFNRSSTMSTLANAWIPYFNAGLQGADKTVRQLKAHPVKTTARAAVSVFLPTLLLYLINKDNDNWKNVKDGVRDNYYLIPNMAGPLDANGNAETFIRLPKSREYGALLSGSFERFMRAIDEEISLSEAFTGYGQTLLNSFMPPSLNDWIGGAARAIKENRAWHGGTIVPTNLTKVSPQYQYDINTSGAAMNLAKLGQKLPLPGELGKSLSSPMKVDYLLDSYTGYAGDVLQGLTSQRNKGRTGQETATNSLYGGLVQPFKNRLSTDSAYSSYTLDKFYNKADEVEIAKNDRNHADNLPSDLVTAEETINSAYTKAQSAISDLTKQEKAILASAAPIKGKNEQIRDLRQQKNAIAKEMLSYPQTLADTYNSVYLPAVDDLNSIPAYNKMNEEDKNKALTKIGEYASDVAKDNIYPNDYYPNYKEPTYLSKVDSAIKNGADLGDALFYRYALNDIENNGGKNGDKRDYLESDKHLSAREKNAIDEAFITDFTFIPKDVEVDYSNHTNTVLTQMSESAQNKWYRFDNMGITVDEYEDVYKAATGGTKAERLENLQSLGYSYSEALQLYKAATKKLS